MSSDASVTRDENPDGDDARGRGAENILEFCRNFFNSVNQVNVTPSSHQSDEILSGDEGDAEVQQATYQLPPNCEEMMSMFNITNISTTNNMVRFIIAKWLSHWSWETRINLLFQFAAEKLGQFEKQCKNLQFFIT